MTAGIIVDTDVIASNEQKELSGFFVARRRLPICLAWCAATGLHACKRFSNLARTLMVWNFAQVSFLPI
jgi:hypothetical protein